MKQFAYNRGVCGHGGQMLEHKQSVVAAAAVHIYM